MIEVHNAEGSSSSTSSSSEARSEDEVEWHKRSEVSEDSEVVDVTKHETVVESVKRTEVEGEGEGEDRGLVELIHRGHGGGFVGIEAEAERDGVR